MATPYPARGVEQLFGTARPTHARVEQGWADVCDGIERWEAHYVVYKRGKPAEYAFIGCSGDRPRPPVVFGERRLIAYSRPPTDPG